MKIEMKDPKNWIPRDVFKSYCGTKSDKLLRFYDKAAKKRNMISMSLNWLAILLLPAWFGYRKQWGMLTTMLVIFAVIPFIEAIFDITIANSGFTGFTIAIGLMCNGFLLANAHRVFIKHKQSGMDEDQIKQALKDKVSPSVPMAFASLILFAVIAIGSSFVADTFWGLPY